MTHAELSRPSRKQRVRTLWISDVHLGTRDCQAEHLSQFLKDYQADRIYLVGDIIDGWKLRSGYKHVNILGDEFPVRADIETLDSFSGHADHGELLEYFDRTGGPKSNIILVHGEEQASLALANALEERQANPVSIAQLGSVMVL